MDAKLKSGFGKLLHAGISVYHMDESVAWYQENLGFAKIRDNYVAALGSRIVFLERDGFEIELFEYDDPKQMPEDRLFPNSDLKTVGTKHIAFEAPDLQALKQEFLEHGVDIAHEVNMGENKVMFVRDCNGVLIEFIEYPQ